MHELKSDIVDGNGSIDSSTWLFSSSMHCGGFMAPKSHEGWIFYVG
jgi:hypothetical protein